MGHKINCKANNQGCWRKDRRVKRSLWGIGARMCLVFEGRACPFQEKYRRPAMCPPSRQPHQRARL